MKPRFLEETEEAFAVNQHVIYRFNTTDRFYWPEEGIGPAYLQFFLAKVFQKKGYRVAQYSATTGFVELNGSDRKSNGDKLKNLSGQQEPYLVLNRIVPLLRDRREDIPILAHYFLKIYSNKMRKEFSRIPHSEMDKLVRYHWPGNVRELENVVERGTILSNGQHFRVPELGGDIPDGFNSNGETTLRDNERRHILWALEKTGWKVRGRGGAAELLDLPASTLAFRMKKLGIQRQKNPLPKSDDNE